VDIGLCSKRKKRDSLRASRKAILGKHENPSNADARFVFCLPLLMLRQALQHITKQKPHNESYGFPFAEKEGLPSVFPQKSE